MRNAFRRLVICLVGFMSIGFTLVVSADVITGDIFFTTFAGGTNVHRVSTDFDGMSTFTLGTPIGIGSTAGADGISGNPQNPDLLLIGGQGGNINTISKSTGTVTVYASPVSVFHLEVPDPTTVYTTGIPGPLVRHTINADGSVSAGTLITLSGSDTVITQLIATPGGFFYTTGSPGGFGNFGMLTFTSATTATTTRLHGGGGSVGGSVLAAAHGGVYDPFSNTIILFGDGHMTQLSLTGVILGDLIIGGVNFDQGTVDGAGHAFAASNTGHLVFLDYNATGLIGGAFSDIQFLANNLDDVAPLVGPGSTDVVPEPTTLALMGLALAGLGLARRRKPI